MLCLLDVGRSDKQGQRRRRRCDWNLCILECSWAFSWQCTSLSLGFTFQLNCFLLPSFLSPFLSWMSVFLGMLFVGSSVQFWREIWYCEIHKDHPESRSICSSSNWALCLCRVEFWVIISVLLPVSNRKKSYDMKKKFKFFFSPFIICRGFPVWLKYVPGISFRTDNEPFKVKISLPFLVPSANASALSNWRNPLNGIALQLNKYLYWVVFFG